MQIYMIRTTRGYYCVFSETAMSKYNNRTEELALTEFSNGVTFDPTDPHSTNFRLTADCTEVYYHRGNSLFGRVLYEVTSPTDTQSYEFW